MASLVQGLALCTVEARYNLKSEKEREVRVRERKEKVREREREGKRAEVIQA